MALITDLPSKTTLQNSDLIVVDDGSHTYKMTYGKFKELVPMVTSFTKNDTTGELCITLTDGTQLKIVPHDPTKQDEDLSTPITVDGTQQTTVEACLAALNTYIGTKQDTLTFDNEPTLNSDNPVKSGGIYSAIEAEKTRAQTAEAGKVDVVAGKGLSTEDYTTAEKIKLSGIESGAEVNVQADWNQSDNTKDDYINNKPSIPVISAHSDYSTGTKIGSVTVDGVETDFYAPTVSHNYGFHIDGNESVPSAKITYLADAVGMEPAKMDYANDVFDYGSWKDAFFLPRPCMLKSDGTVDYYLDPDDYTKKADGTASDIANDAYDGNAMMEWGKNGRKIWYKIVPDANDDTSASVYIADYQVDEGYVDYPFHSFDGASHNHFYTPIFNGWLDTNNKLRSISGKQVMASKTATNEVTYATNNNPADTPIWNIEQYCDIVLITILLWLMGKSTNTQDVFGNGISSGGQAGCEAYRTGALNDKGMFYGKDGSVNTTTAVKVFGMENFWGLQWRRYQGHLLISGSQYVKMTYGQEDGSTADGFSLAGTGYINKGHQPTGTSGQYLKTQEYDSMGFYPKNANSTDASATKYYCDGLWFNNSGTRVPIRGGSSSNGALDGAWAVALYYGASNARWDIGASLSCKPLS
jgi:hypothetical protein